MDLKCERPTITRKTFLLSILEFFDAPYAVIHLPDGKANVMKLCFLKSKRYLMCESGELDRASNP